MGHVISEKFRLPIVLLALFFCHPRPIAAQRVLSLDSCRALAIGNNKELGMSRTKRGMAEEMRKAVRTNYLPKVDAIGTYQFSSREISLLSKKQQGLLNNLGTNLTSQLKGDMAQTLPSLVQQGAISASQAQLLSGVAEQLVPGVTSALNEVGGSLRKAFRTNNRNLFGADIMVRQPVYMGGALKAENKVADISASMAEDNIDLMAQKTLYDVEQAYWLVVSLRQKQALANDYLALVRKLYGDVSKMLAEGVTTKANELRVAVRVNEAEMSRTQVDDGLVLARMHLCQICGLDLDTDIKLVDEGKNSQLISAKDGAVGFCPELLPDSIACGGTLKEECALEEGSPSRPELRLLANTVELSRQNAIIVRAAFLPQVLATGGYLLSNPNVLNGYRNTCSGMFHVGVSLRVPVWNWGEGRHKVRAAKAATAMARLELDEAREKIGLQVRQAEFRVDEACKKLGMAVKSLSSAEENLRCASVGFKEGVLQTADVMEAQTAWQMARSQKIDAMVDVKMAHVNLRKALGTLKM